MAPLTRAPSGHRLLHTHDHDETEHRHHEQGGRAQPHQQQGDAVAGGDIAQPQRGVGGAPSRPGEDGPRRGDGALGRVVTRGRKAQLGSRRAQHLRRASHRRRGPDDVGVGARRQHRRRGGYRRLGLRLAQLIEERPHVPSRLLGLQCRSEQPRLGRRTPHVPRPAGRAPPLEQVLDLAGRAQDACAQRLRQLPSSPIRLGVHHHVDPHA